jgi:hypothetical protein
MLLREIKFRGKDLASGEWVYGSLVQIPEGAVIISKSVAYQSENEISFDKSAGAQFYNVRPDTIGMFTGYHDTNYEEIYDGDVLQEIAINKRKVYTVEFRNGAFRMIDGHDPYPPLLNSYDTKNYKIIGNVYEG